MNLQSKQSKIVSKIKQEVVIENAKLKEIKLASGKEPLVCGHQGCSESACNNYCSES